MNQKKPQRLHERLNWKVTDCLTWINPCTAWSEGFQLAN